MGSTLSKAKQAKPLLEQVPAELLEKLGPELVGSLLVPFLAAEGAPLGVTVSYIIDAQRYQNLICDEDQEMAKGVRDIGWRWFREHIRDVEVIERKGGNGKLLGRKARIILDTVVDAKKRGNEKYASIDTGWIEYFGWDKDKLNWEIALANHIMEIAEENIGKDVSVLKHVWPGDGMNKYRQVINIRHIFNASDVPDDDDEDDDVDETESDDSIVYTKKDVRKAFKDANFDYNDEDVDVSLEILEDELTSDEVLDEVADYFDKDSKDIVVSKEAKKAIKDEDMLDYVTLLVMDNVEPQF